MARMHHQYWRSGGDPRLLTLLLALVCVLGCGHAGTRPVGSASSDRRPPRAGVVAAPQPIAAEYGAQVLRDGGNAVDAAVATALMLGVVDGHNSGIGGGCFITIRTAAGELVCIDSRETAPALASRDMFLRDGKADAALSRTGALAVGVPGSLAAYELALREYGTRTLAELLRGAAAVADAGFAIDEKYARRIADQAETLRRFPGSAEMLLKPDGSPYAAGETLKLPDLARTYRAIADHGIDWFYRGPFARDVDAWMQANGGLLRYDDFAGYEAKRREPVVTTYRGHAIVGFPPPSSGGVHVAQILNILEHFDLASMDEATRRHVIAEAMKLAFADRAHWLGDPDFARVPRGLASKQYAAELAQRIRLDAAMKVESHGTPAGAEQDVFPRLTKAQPGAGANIELRTSHASAGAEAAPAFGASMLDAARPMFDVRANADSHTAHLSTADEHGNWVALTATVNTGFGSKVVVPGTGVILNNQMDDFVAQPGVPNAFGLIGAEANAVEPGKRPLSSMCPTIVLVPAPAGGEATAGAPVLSVGGAGGPWIISGTLQAIVNVLDLGMPLGKAVAAPRAHHQWSPDELVVEASLDPAVRRRLTALGHSVRERRNDEGAVVQAISRGSGGEWAGVADPRSPGGVRVSTPGHQNPE